jgi:F420H(2)-dependent quinone reductase
MATASKGLKRIMKVANGLHAALYRASGGRFANKTANLPVLLLTTYGRKTGTPHTNPVVYLKDGQDYLVSATVGGMDWHPGWYLNLAKRLEARIQVGDRSFHVRVTITEAEERSRLYEKFKAAADNFVKYEKNTSRVLPVIRLTPVP